MSGSRSRPSIRTVGEPRKPLGDRSVVVFDDHIADADVVPGAGDSGGYGEGGGANATQPGTWSTVIVCGICSPPVDAGPARFV